MYEYKPLIKVIHSALAYAVKAAKEGRDIEADLCPEEFLEEYLSWSGLDDFDAIPDLVAAQVDDWLDDDDELNVLADERADGPFIPVDLAEGDVQEAAKAILKASVDGDKWSFPPAVIEAMRNHDERHADIPDESAASYYGLMLINALIELAGMAEPPLPDNVERLWR